MCSENVKQDFVMFFTVRFCFESCLWRKCVVCSVGSGGVLDIVISSCNVCIVIL